MSQYHESEEKLSEETKNFSRALNSLKEEIEAIDWYQQRVDATNDENLKEILAHNRDEEIEHACMALEWLRRNMPAWDNELKTYMFAEGNIAHLEEGEAESQDSDNKSLNIGKLNK